MGKATKPTLQQQVKDLTRERDRIQAELTETQQELTEARQKNVSTESARMSAVEAANRNNEDRKSVAASLAKAADTIQQQVRQILDNRADFNTIRAIVFEREPTKDDPDAISAVQDLKDSYKARVQERDDARRLKWFWVAILAGTIAMAAISVARGQATASYAWDDQHLSLHVPQEVLQKFRNPDGSCVQCSNSMTGTDQNVGAFAYLLWDSEYGSKVRGGSSPSRVERYAKERNVRIYNVTGKSTWDWMRWACANGRGAAIGAGGNHFQTLVGYDPPTKRWFVVNNNGDQRIQEYSDEAFRRLHLASGQWCVILDYPPAPAPPKYLAWWKNTPP